MCKKNFPFPLITYIFPIETVTINEGIIIIIYMRKIHLVVSIFKANITSHITTKYQIFVPFHLEDIKKNVFFFKYGNTSNC